jgi:hypothetical protein
LDAFAGEAGTNGIPRKARAQSEGMRQEIRVASQPHVDGGDMEGAETLILEFAMLDHRVVLEDQLCDRIGKI